MEVKKHEKVTLFLTIIIICMLGAYLIFCDKSTLCYLYSMVNNFLYPSKIKPNIPLLIKSKQVKDLSIKVNHEWIIEHKNQRLILIGIESNESKDFNICELSDKNNSQLTTSKLDLYQIDSDSANCSEIHYLKLPVKSNCVKFNLPLQLGQTYKDKNKLGEEYLFFDKKIFIFHPTTRKWLCLNSSDSFSNLPLLSNNKSLTKDKSGELRPIPIFSSKTLDLLEDEILYVDSMKVYLEKHGTYLRKYKLFSWYVEKKEEIAPEGEDE